MAFGVHHQRPKPRSRVGRFVLLSFVLHVIGLVLLSFSLAHSVRMAPPAALQVRLVGVPMPKASAKQVKEEKIRTQDSPAPKEPPPETKNMPETDAQSKFAIEDPDKEKAKDDKQHLVEAKKRPPVLDKNPEEKKVVKNDKDAKVVKNPDDFLKALDFVDKLENAQPTEKQRPKTDEKAGEGPTLQLNMSQQGVVDGIRSHIEKNWLIPPGMDTSALAVSVEVRIDTEGNVTFVRLSRSSGNAAFDNSLLRAVRKASPLPVPQNDYDTFKVMDLQFTGQ